MMEHPSCGVRQEENISMGMGTFLFNGIEFIVDFYSGYFREALENAGMEYEEKQVPVEFLTRPFIKYYLCLYKYKSVKEDGKTVYVVSIEQGDEEGAGSIIFQTYEKIDLEIAAALEDAYYNKELELSDDLRDFLY